jgi:hypothetical protein
MKPGKQEVLAVMKSAFESQDLYEHTKLGSHVTTFHPLLTTIKSRYDVIVTPKEARNKTLGQIADIVIGLIP